MENTFGVRTDLAVEETESFPGNGGEISGVSLREWHRAGSRIKMTEVKILDKKGEKAMGKPMASSLLSLFREVVLGVGFAIMLPMLFGLDGVLYAMPTADLLTAVASIAVIILTYRELGVRSQAVHQDGRVSSVSKD